MRVYDLLGIQSEYYSELKSVSCFRLDRDDVQLYTARIISCVLYIDSCAYLDNIYSMAYGCNHSTCISSLNT